MNGVENMNGYDKQRERIVAYLRSGEDRREDFRIGVEFEHFVIDRATGKTVSYYGPQGVEESLRDIHKQGWNEYYNDEYLLGLDKGPFTISTEPGSQFEISIEAQKDIKNLEEKYLEFFQQVLKTFEDKNQILVALGYHPITKIDDIKILPKKRYGYMYDYFKKRGGTLAHNMMKGTAAVQVTIDFENEEDFILKSRVANALSPILYTLYDNSYIFEGDIYPKRNIRQKIWENTDKDRSGIVPTVFDLDFSYRKYAEYILNNPVIFLDREGVLEGTGEKPFYEVFDPDKDGDEMIYHAMSIVFPDVRAKRYLEIRMMDAVPYPLNFSAVALIKGLFYHEENLNRLSKRIENITREDVLRGKESSEELGMQGNYLGQTFREWGIELIKMAVEGLDEEEKHYLEPLEVLVEEGVNRRDLFEETYQKEGILEAIRQAQIEVRNV